MSPRTVQPDYLSVSEQNGIQIYEVLPNRFDRDHFSFDFRHFLVGQSERYKNAIVDLGNVEFVDSDGISSLVAGLKENTLKEGRLDIANLQDPVRAIFELIKLHKIFDIYNSVDDAVNQSNKVKFS